MCAHNNGLLWNPVPRSEKMGKRTGFGFRILPHPEVLGESPVKRIEKKLFQSGSPGRGGESISFHWSSWSSSGSGVTMCQRQPRWWWRSAAVPLWYHESCRSVDSTWAKKSSSIIWEKWKRERERIETTTQKTFFSPTCYITVMKFVYFTTSVYLVLY